MMRISLSVLIALLAGLVNGCGGANATRTAVNQDSIYQINTPFREHGYSNLNHKIIATEDEFSDFLMLVESQDHWNEKQAFLHALLHASVDFSRHNLMFFRMTEGSGSIELTPEPATVAAGDAYIHVERFVPSGGTADMAYYALVHAVAKTIDEIHITVGTRDIIFDNNADTAAIPKNCAVWFDGCNECSVTDHVRGCTEKFCNFYEPAYCRTWQD